MNSPTTFALWRLIIVLTFATFFRLGASEETISLAGRWRFQLDRADAGVAERWFVRPLPDAINLPGSLPAQNVGDPVTVDTKWVGSIVDKSWFTDPRYAKYREPGNVKVPFWLTPEKYYSGSAWYQRDVVIPEDWKDKRVVLSLERPHWETIVWVDDKPMGSNNALATPHEYNLGQLLPGRHAITIRVRNGLLLDIGENSHSVSDHTQGNWNGIVGRIELHPTPLVWIEDVQVYPNAGKKSVRVVVTSTNASQKKFQGKLSLFFEQKGKSTRLPVSVNFNTTSEDLTVSDDIELGPNATTWDEFRPDLHFVRAELVGEVDGRRIESKKTTTYGLRDISVEGTQFTINGRKIFIRGTLDCCIYPLTGHPPTDVESWKRVINICKAHGLNLIRFHSWCPPEAAFVAADELGFYFQVEASSWANQSTTLGDGKPVDNWIYTETDRILKYYGNHPSFILMPYGNEPGGKNYSDYLAKWVNHYKALDSRRLWTSGAGWPQIPENQFHITPDPRIQAWSEGLKSRINQRPPETMADYRDYIQKRGVPTISHEIGQWCVYPNFDEIKKYTGYLKPRNFEIFRDSLEAHHLGDLAQKFMMASGKLQTLCYKEDIESALRTPGMGGFELLDLHDFPGQGTALVGVLDPFWESKGYVTAEEYRRFCNATVPLARLRKRAFTTDENFTAQIEVTHVGERPWTNAVTNWKLMDDTGKIHAQGRFTPQMLPLANATPIGTVNVNLKKFPSPARYKLVVSVGDSKPASTCENDWDIWVYPAKVSSRIPAGVTVVKDLDAVALARLNAGGKVLWLIPPKAVTPDEKLGKVALGFSSIFWNTAWTARQSPHTLGILVDPQHPLFSEFPTDFHSNWQWWYLVSRAGAMILDSLPANLRPTVQVIDDWVTNRKLGLAFEARVGAGKLFVCSIDLDNDLEADPVRCQFRHSLLRYMSAKEFDPTNSVTGEQLRNLMITKELPMGKIGLSRVFADSEAEGNEAENAIDGDPKTIWHTPWRPSATEYPHYLQLEFKSRKRLRGFNVLPRQDGNRNGWICDYAFYASDDGKNWGEPVHRGSFLANKDLKTVLFDRPVRGRYFQFVALAGFAGPLASVAELSLLEETNRQDAESGRKQAANQTITIDTESPGLTFDGVGAVSSGGSSRLLVDYPEPERGQILDYLFKPNYGAALQILKVEIGADTDATCGAEPSHQRIQGVTQCNLGYEWWLMKEAKARNPGIKLYALAWGAPGWMTNGYWSDENIGYTLAWLDCAKQNGFQIDYLGGGNERGRNADYYIKLRKALNDHGYSQIKVVASDDHTPPGYWSAASEMKTNRAFADAVDILGEHDVCVWRTEQRHCYVSEDARALNKPLWDSENSTQDYAVGHEALARAMNRHYIEGRITGNLNWSLVGAYYGSFPAPGTGLLLADRPWSGWYGIGRSVWVDAHTTQFAQPGWRYLDSACGYTVGGATYVTMAKTDGMDYSIVIETMDLRARETLNFALKEKSPRRRVNVWKTILRSNREEDHFVKTQTLEPINGAYQITIEPGCIYSLTTTTGQGKGAGKPKAKVTERMALPYHEDFENAGSDRLAKYFSDVHGGFEVAPCGSGRSGNCYRQMITREPILWHGAKMPPTTILGDPLWWGDYEVSADVLLEGPGYAELLGRIESQQHNVAGYHFRMADTGAWTLYTQDENGHDQTLASGANASVGTNVWHRLALNFRDDQIIALVDGKQVATVRDNSHRTGQVGLRVNAWQHAQFDDLNIVKIAPWPEFIPHTEMVISASSEQTENHFGAVHAAEMAIDDRVETSWRSRYAPPAPLPQSITIDLKRPRQICGMSYRPEITDTEKRTITTCRILCSADGRKFDQIASGNWPETIATKVIDWPTCSARYIRLEAVDELQKKRLGVGVAEIEIFSSK